MSCVRVGALSLLDPQPASFEAVERRYAAESGAGGGGWTLRNLQRADRRFGTWVRARIATAEIGYIVLPHHVGGCDRHSGLPQDIHLVPPTGLTVALAHARLDRIREAYRAAAAFCYARIERARMNAPSGLGAFFLSREPLMVGSSYGGLGRYRGCPTHLDGLHRLLGLMDATERPPTIECYVALGTGAALNAPVLEPDEGAR